MIRRLAALLLVAVSLAAPAVAQMPYIPTDTYNNPVADFQRDVKVLQAEQALLRSQMVLNAPPGGPTAAYAGQVNEMKRQFWQYTAGATAPQGGAPYAVARYAANHYGLMTGRITPQEYEAQRAALLAAPAGQPGILKALVDTQAALDPAAQQRLTELRTTSQSNLSRWEQFEPTAWQQLTATMKQIDQARALLAKDKSKAEQVFDDTIVWRTRLQDDVSTPYHALVQSTGYRNRSLENAILDVNNSLNALQASARAARK